MQTSALNAIGYMRWLMLLCTLGALQADFATLRNSEWSRTRLACQRRVSCKFVHFVHSVDLSPNSITNVSLFWQCYYCCQNILQSWISRISWTLRDLKSCTWSTTFRNDFDSLHLILKDLVCDTWFWRMLLITFDSNLIHKIHKHNKYRHLSNHACLVSNYGFPIPSGPVKRWWFSSLNSPEVPFSSMWNSTQAPFPWQNLSENYLVYTSWGLITVL